MGTAIRILFALLVCWFAAAAADSAELKPPARAVAGEEVALETSGDGTATFYLAGPASSAKREVRLGEPVRLSAEDTRNAGRYTAILRQDGRSSAVSFYVHPARPASLSFLARPSRVPAGFPEGISGVAYPLDAFNNLVLEPTEVRFELSVTGAAPAARTVRTRNGVAWTRMDAGRKEGAAQFVATVGGVTARRVVQQVAAEPCNLSFRAQRTPKAIVVETAPVRDCAGNPVPDGTIVTFIQVDGRGKSTVDARVKRGVARAELPPAESATIFVASGVVSGNEIRLGGGQ